VASNLYYWIPVAGNLYWIPVASDLFRIPVASNLFWILVARNARNSNISLWRVVMTNHRAQRHSRILLAQNFMVRITHGRTDDNMSRM
jgi:hypothetical protein